MKAEFYARARQIFGAALERSPEEREDYLSAACAADDELGREVASLLTAHGKAADFLEQSPIAASESLADSRLGSRLGAYRLQRRLGDGGMGAVYLALRADAEFQKRVAIKLLRRGLEGEGWVKRLQAERQILAALDHPNIARLLDGGTTEDGLPYLVMEFIEGEPIDHFCDSRKLRLEERLELFRRVCAAVHFAHQNLVVHRDLKPSNILVDSTGRVKLLDFGIAKLLNPELSAKSFVPTSEVMQLMTPEYACPEQMLGQPISTAADVYSLGVLLYRLLACRPPYNLAGCSPAEVVEQVCRRMPDRPSTVVDRSASPSGDSVDVQQLAAARGTEPARLRRALRGDLDTIVLKALRKEPYRRYESAAELADDLDLHCRGLPVRARGDSLGYRWSKFLRRNAMAVGLGAALFLAVLGFGLAMAMQRGEVVRERDRAAEAQRGAEQLSGFLKSLFEASNRATGKEQLTVREMLDRGGRLLLAGSLAVEPRTGMGFHLTLAEIYRALGFYGEARQHAAAASAIARQLSDHSELAGALVLTASIDLQLAEVDAAEQSLAEAKRLLEPLAAGDARCLAVLDELAQVRRYQGRVQEAERLLQDNLASYRALLGGSHPKVATTHDRLATTLRSQGRIEEALLSYQQALEIFRDLGSRPLDEARILSNLANLHLAEGRLSDAERLQEEALAILRQLFDRPHPKIAVVLFSLASTHWRKGEIERARDLFRESLDIRRRVYSADHPEIGRSLTSLAVVLRALGEPRQAEAMLQQALLIFRAEEGAAGLLATNLYHLANVQLDLGRPDVAERLIREAIALERAAEGDRRWQISRAESVLGGALLEQGRLVAAESLLRASQEGLNSRPKSQESREATARLAALYRQTGRAGQAAALESE